MNLYLPCVAILLTLVYCESGLAQSNHPQELKVRVIKNTQEQVPLRYSDSVEINFDLGFDHDTITVKTGGQTYSAAELTTDGRDGHAGSLKIPKLHGRQRIDVYIGSDWIGHLVLKKKFSAVHVNKGKQCLFWTYLNYALIYL